MYPHFESEISRQDSVCHSSVESMELLPLHKHPSLMDICAEILNQEWPRSKGARLHSLSKSCDTLPVALALVQKSGHDGPCVIGFGKLSSVQGQLKACFVESVVVQTADRGKGFGRVLMELMENYAKSLGLQTLYLNTTDKESFYSHLGYTHCRPILSFGDNAHRVPEAMLKHFMGLPTSDTDHSQSNSNSRLPAKALSDGSLKVKAHSNSISSNSSSVSTSTQPPPAPPPPPPPSAPPPPAPPPPLATKNSKLNPSDSKAIQRLDPNCVVWMKKELS